MKLQRVLSNLINNSVEAFPEKKGRVTVSVRAYKEKVQLTIKDNGSGIPPEVLKKLGEQGVTHGKAGTESGSGLGVYYAKSTIEAMGGTFNISSQVDLGTLIDMQIPRAEVPSWFLESISLTPGTEVFCLDDDMTIHQVWGERFNLLGAVNKNIVIKNFTSADEFKNCIKSTLDSAVNSRFYLIDYELLGQNTNGLNIIEELKLRDNVVLVSSRYEEPEIKRRCVALKIKLLPKSLAGFVPIKFV